MIDTSGEVIDTSGEMIDTSGEVIDNSGEVIDTPGEVIDTSGEDADVSSYIADISREIDDSSRECIESSKEISAGNARDSTPEIDTTQFEDTRDSTPEIDTTQLEDTRDSGFIPSGKTMFQAIAEKFTKGVSSDDAYVPVSSIASAHDLKLLQIVVKRKKRHFIFWNKVTYKPYNFELSDVLLNPHTPMRVDEISQEAFCKWHRTIKLSLGGKFGLAILDELGDVSLSTSDTVNIEANLGQLNLVKLDSSSLERELIKRRINLSHVLIEQIRRNKNSVLCVVQSIIKLAQDAEVRRTDKFDISGNASAHNPVNESIAGNVSGTLDDDIVRDIGLIKNQPISYKVWELQVDKFGGEIVPCINSDISGGFIDSDDIVGRPLQPASTIDSGNTGLETDGAGIALPKPVDSPEKVYRILRPLLSMPEIERGKIKELLFKAPAEDFETLDVLFDQVENRFSDSGTTDTLSFQGISGLKFKDRTTCCDFLKLAGFELEEEKITSPVAPTPEFEACCHLLEAMTELPEDVMLLVRSCKSEFCRTLLHVIEEFMRGKPMVEFTRYIEQLARDETGMKILNVLNIEVDLIRKNPLRARSWRFSDCIDEVYWWLCAVLLR
ncbi:gasdermin-E-like isoform X2 [Ylistrum balloti]|uniref:gasdermin-E-like isoform X2 n=1 Tax=Ylistrum balloti TaxID=509963 RepID=UPI0029059167|nr:gasdermin-E-like isoform X2 [Ylistrum balloti]